MMPSSIAHGIKFVHPMFRGFTQQVSQCRRIAIMSEVGISAFMYFKCYCLFCHFKLFSVQAQSGAVIARLTIT